MRVPDFELGNSPAAVAAGRRRGEELVLATTNGSPAIVAASSAARRVVAALDGTRSDGARVAEPVGSAYAVPVEARSAPRVAVWQW